MTQCLVTGGAGFVGQHLVSLLEKEQYNVRIVSRKKFDGFDSVVHDFEVERFPKEYLKDVDVVFHLAGYAHDLNNPAKHTHKYYSVNVDSTVELAKMSASSGVKSFVFVSSVKAGGRSLTRGCALESDFNTPEGIYGETKRKAELELIKIGERSDMQVTILRPSLVYGPSVKGNLKLMLLGIKYRWFPPLPIVDNFRTMVHVDDLVRAILFVSENKLTDGEIYNITDGILYTPNQIYNILRVASGKKLCKISTPMFVFNLVSLLGSGFKYKVKKLLGHECYSSEKIENIGFSANKTLKDINLTDYKL